MTLWRSSICLLALFNRFVEFDSVLVLFLVDPFDFSSMVDEFLPWGSFFDSLLFGECLIFYS